MSFDQDAFLKEHIPYLLGNLDLFYSPGCETGGGHRFASRGRAGAYAETCHIQPLGRPHNGPDLAESPNCHVLFDELSVWVNEDCSLGERDGSLRANSQHII